MKHYSTYSNPLRPQFNSMAGHQAQHFAYAFDSGFATLSLIHPERKNALTGHAICMQTQNFKSAFNAFIDHQILFSVGD